MIIANPTAASAAATVITKKTRTCPSNEPSSRDKATNAKLTAFNISSMDMNMISMFRLTKTPKTPMVKRTALNIRYEDNGTIF
jgi:hypothetical protein